MVRMGIFITILLYSLASLANRDILFEGYFKITSEDKHIGYNLVRYEYDTAKKTFHSTYLTKISNAGNEFMESVSASAMADTYMTPIEYKYIGLVGSNSTSIEATFTKGKKEKDKNKMKIVRTENSKKPVTTNVEIAHDVFLSTFLTYRMLRSELGIQTNSKLNYFAVAEEDGKVVNGKAEVLNEEKYKGFTAFKIKNTFKDVMFESYVTDKGEALATRVIDARILSELVPKAADAIGTVGLPESIAKRLFGKVPLGSKNVVTQYFNNKDNAPEKGGKTEGFPAGEGIIISPKDPKKQEGP
ncbi:MAG: hypothetical protein ACK5V3_04820 [Bdellovibrionales bacterium]